MEFRVRHTSAGRDWSDFEAEIYDASAGHSELAHRSHGVSMQLGRPLLVTSRCNGETDRRLQAPGDIKIVPAGISRVWETESATVKMTMFVLPALVRAAAEAMELDYDRIALTPQLYVRDPRIEHIGWAVKAELESREPYGRLYAEGLGLSLAAQLLRRYATNARPAGSLAQRRLNRVREYIRANLANDLSLFELAKVAGVSPSHFKALFRNAVGVPVHQYVIRERVAYAARTLQRDASRLVDVALQAGFSSPSHLARCMRRVMGVTPAQLREYR